MGETEIACSSGSQRYTRLVDRHLGRCLFFWLWALVGGALLLSALSSIGVFTILPALSGIVLVASRSPCWPEPLGLLGGFGTLSLTIGTLAVSQNGVDPVPWLVAGIVLVLGGSSGTRRPARPADRRDDTAPQVAERLCG